MVCIVKVLNKLVNYLTQYFGLGDEKEQNQLTDEFQKALNDFLTYSDPDLYPYSSATIKV